MIAENDNSETDPSDPIDSFDSGNPSGEIIDADVIDDDFDDFDDQISPEEAAIMGPVKKRRRMFCSNCNRTENHRPANRRSWINSYFTGLAFGLNRFLGPFKCTCCGHNRWLFKITRKGIK